MPEGFRISARPRRDTTTASRPLRDHARQQPTLSPSGMPDGPPSSYPESATRIQPTPPLHVQKENGPEGTAAVAGSTAHGGQFRISGSTPFAMAG